MALFTNPFAYAPRPEIEGAAEHLIYKIASLGALNTIFEEGKMLGVLEVENAPEDDPLINRIDGRDFLFAFSGLAGGTNKIDGFVPPIFDYMDPQGHFKRTETEISAINALLENCSPEDAAALKIRRKEMSVELQKWLFDQYVVHNAQGQSQTIGEIFESRGLVPPGGTGECAAPKLLEYAYLRGYRPLAMGEFWYGKSYGKQLRMQGCFYPSCTSKCGPLLGFMLEGLDVEPSYGAADDYEVLYEDEAIIVASKPSGMLSVPGRIPSKSLLERLKERYRTEEIYSCHRLDMDTSGVMVFARSLRYQANLQGQFENREVEKSYLALLLPGEKPLNKKGRIELPVYPDWDLRPRQKVDFDEGRPAVTDYEILETRPDGCCKVRFFPKTGRTHQLRVHSAHPDGLGRPIVGDRLYGGVRQNSVRLCLHAEKLTFTHPLRGEKITAQDTCRRF